MLTIILRMFKRSAMAAALLLASAPLGGLAQSQSRQNRNASAEITVLHPARVWDGETMHEGWAVRVKGDRIDAVGPPASVASAGAKAIDLPGTTLTPGLVEGHSHILLHAYSETSWTDQVSREGLALRVARATNHLRDTLMAGFTTVRDLGTEGAGYADVELRQAVTQGIIPGPRILASTRAIVATGSYQPKFIPEWNVPQGAEEADGIDSLMRVVRDQIGRGADWIKLYGDYRFGPLPGSHPTFSADEMKLAVETAASAGVPVAVHSNTAEGMRRAALANVATIEHGGEGTPEVFKLMAEHHVALCPTITAGMRTCGRRPGRTRPLPRASARASKPRWTPASRSSAAAMSAPFHTATTPASSRRWSATACRSNERSSRRPRRPRRY